MIICPLVAIERSGYYSRYSDENDVRFMNENESITVMKNAAFYETTL